MPCRVVNMAVESSCCDMEACDAGCRRDTLTGVNSVYFLFQVAIVFPSTHHMTPGHSLLIRAILDPPLVQDAHMRTHIITHSVLHNGPLVIAGECTGSLSGRFED